MYQRRVYWRDQNAAFLKLIFHLKKNERPAVSQKQPRKRAKPSMCFKINLRV